MKYIKLFKNDAEYQAFREGEDYITPNLCLNSETWETKCEPEEEEVNLITFTVNGTEYYAEDGMTWEEFINSDYNPTIFIFDSEFEEFMLVTNYVVKYNTSGIASYIALNGVKVVFNEQILGQEYSTQIIK